MHGLDNALGEFEAGIDALESGNEMEFGEFGQGEYEGEFGQGEYEGEYEGELSGEYGQGEYEGEYEYGQGEQETVFDEVQEMELAAELLEVHGEAELEQFFGKLIKGAGSAVGGAVKPSIFKTLGGALRKVAKVALPMAGKVLGNMVLPGVGGMIGGKLASAAGSMFGLELEGMSAQDQEFEVARRVVRLSGEAVRQAVQMPPTGNPVVMAKDAVLAAAARHAPGLAGRAGATAGGCKCGKGRHPGGGYGGGHGYGGGPRGSQGGGYPPRPRPGYDGYAGGGSPQAGTGGYPQQGPSGGYGAPRPGGGRRGRRGLGQRGTWFARGNAVVLVPGA